MDFDTRKNISLVATLLIHLISVAVIQNSLPKLVITVVKITITISKYLTCLCLCQKIKPSRFHPKLDPSLLDGKVIYEVKACDIGDTNSENLKIYRYGTSNYVTRINRGRYNIYHYFDSVLSVFRGVDLSNTYLFYEYVMKIMIILIYVVYTLLQFFPVEKIFSPFTWGVTTFLFGYIWRDFLHNIYLGLNILWNELIYVDQIIILDEKYYRVEMLELSYVIVTPVYNAPTNRAFALRKYTDNSFDLRCRQMFLPYLTFANGITALVPLKNLH